MITVSDTFRKRVIKALGYPVVSDEVIFQIYSEDEVDEVIEDALEEWTNYFGRTKQITVPATSTVTEIDLNTLLPNETVWGIAHYQEEDNSAVEGNNVSMSSMMTNTSSQTLGYTSTRRGWGSYGTPFNYFVNEVTGSVKTQSAMLGQTQENLAEDYLAEFDEINNKLKVKSLKGKPITVLFVLFDEDIDRIPRQFRHKFEEYCQAQLKKEFGYTLSLSDSELSLSFDAASIKSDGEDEIEKLETWMSENSTIPVML